MKHCEAKMSSKGQVTIPAVVREALALKEGDKVDFYLVPGSRRVEIVARNLDIMDLAGCLAEYAGDVPLTQEAMDEAIAAEVGEDDDRIRREAAEWYEFQQWRAERKAG